MFLVQMPQSYLENLLLMNPGVQTFPGLSSFQDAAQSGVTIPNPTPTTGLPNYAFTLPVVTRAQILVAFQALANNQGGAPGGSLRARLFDVTNTDTDKQDIYDIQPANNNPGGYTIGQVV